MLKNYVNFTKKTQKGNCNMGKKIDRKRRVSFDTMLLAVSFWMIFITIEGSFSVQILLPILILIIFYKIIIQKNFRININGESKILFCFIIALVFSTVVNAVINNEYFSYDTLIGVAYFIVIYLWYLFNTNKFYEAVEIKCIINSYIWMSLLCSIMLIMRFLTGQLGKIAMINFLNVEIDENYVSALISMATLFLFNNILNNKTKEKTYIKILKYIILGVNLLAIALSGSRAALIGTILCIGLSYILAFGKSLTIKKIIKLLLILVIIIGIGVKILDYIPTWTFDRYFNSNYADNSNNKRVLMWKNGINGFLNSPIYGYSIRIFDQIPEFSTVNGFEIPERVPAHQTYIDLLLYAGILGFIPFMLFVYIIFKNNVIQNEKRLLPMIIFFIFITNIIGAEKSVFMWNNLILFTIIGNYTIKHKNINDII